MATLQTRCSPLPHRWLDKNRQKLDSMETPAGCLPAPVSLTSDFPTLRFYLANHLVNTSLLTRSVYDMDWRLKERPQLKTSYKFRNKSFSPQIFNSSLPSVTQKLPRTVFSEFSLLFTVPQSLLI